MLNIFLIPNPAILKSPKPPTAIASKRLAPITSSIDNALFKYIYFITTVVFPNATLVKLMA